MKLYVYVGTMGFFNAVKDLNPGSGVMPGGATDVRLNYSNNWWDHNSLISRIMVAAGAGSGEWRASIGGNSGGLTGGESTSGRTQTGTSAYSTKCPGATQTGASTCDSFSTSIQGSTRTCVSAAGTFGSAGKPSPIVYDNFNDYGGWGGGGYYGGTSYQYAFAGSGGSSFISGYEGCDAVKNQSSIEHTGQPNHYSGMIFTQSEMINGGSSLMLLPSEISRKGVYTGSGAFRLTLLMYKCKCTCKNSLSFTVSPFVLWFVSN